MVYTITFNPSLDYIVDVNEFNIGSVNRTSAEIIYPGGKGINVAMVLKELNVAAKAWGFTAGFTGDMLKSLLADKGIDTDFISLDEGFTRINVKLRSGGETEINGKGPVVSPAAVEKLCEKLQDLKSGDYLVLAGSVPAGMSQSIYLDILDRLAGSGVNMVVDASGDLLVEALKAGPFLIKPNNYELADIFGVEIKTGEEAALYSKKLQEKGARNVLCSMAGEGAVLVTETGEVLASGVPEGKVKNSVGAGDSMLAGFLAGYMESGDYKKALKLGICAGSASAFSEALATREEIAALYEKVF